MIGSVDLGLGSVNTAAENPNGGNGTGDVDSVTGIAPIVVNNADPANPVVSVTVFAGTPEPVGAASAGTSPNVARGNHSHTTIQVATVAALALVDAAAMNAGVPAFVDTLQAVFVLRRSAQAAAALVRIAALNRAGYLWIRESMSPSWWNQTTWHINPATGSDEATGATALLPLATFAEYRRRHYARWLPGTETGSVTVNIAGGNLGANDYIQAYWTNGLRGGDQILTVTGTATAVASGTIAVGATAINRATGQRNEIDAGFAWAAHVGRAVRLTATPTTQAIVMQDLGGTRCALGEQSVNGILGAGFTAGQAIEVITNTTAPGVHCAGAGAPNVINLVNIDITGASPTSRIGSGPGGKLNAFNCRFIAATSLVIPCQLFTPFACAFVGPGTISTSGVFFSDLCTNVNLSAGIGLGNPDTRNHIASHTSQGPAFVIQENSYCTISGTGSGTIGIFGLAAGQIGISMNIAAHMACSQAWGSGNDAASLIFQRGVGSSFSDVGDGAANYTGLVAQGLGFRLRTGVVGTIFDVPLSELPSAIGDGQQPASSNHFTAHVQTGLGGPVFSYAAAGDAPTVNAPLRWGFPSSEKLALALRARVVAGALAVPATATLYRNGVATAMQVTIAAGAVVGTKYVDIAHPILIADGGDYDLRVDAPTGGVDAEDLQVSMQVEWAG